MFTTLHSQRISRGNFECNLSCEIHLKDSSWGNEIIFFPYSSFPFSVTPSPSPLPPPPLFFIFHIPIYFSNYLYLRFSCIWKNLSLSLESAFRSYKGRHKNTRQPARSRRLGVRHLRGRVKGEMEKGRQSKFPFPRITFPSFHIKISPEHFPQIRPSHLCLRVREESH